MYGIKQDYKQKDGGLNMFEGGNGGNADATVSVIIMFVLVFALIWIAGGAA